nr:MAG TPA: hypothetical protein [Caudoviricetes sp.]
MSLNPEDITYIDKSSSSSILLNLEESTNISFLSLSLLLTTNTDIK